MNTNRIKNRISILSSVLVALVVFLMPAIDAESLTYVVVDTGQDACYDTSGRQMSPADTGEYLYGQDAQYSGNQPAYRDNGDGTITDLNTGLIWQETPPRETMLWSDALDYADSLTLGGKSDWRLPTIKELLSIADFNGSHLKSIPYVDTSVFTYYYPDEVGQNRDMDGQYWSSTESVARTMNNDDSAFGFNFADGRIKAYPKYRLNGFVRCVRGGSGYGENDFVNNGDGTITDQATGLMWTTADSASTMDWPDALAYAESATIAGYSDWRLPNAKELHSIVDYSRAPDHPGSAALRTAAIDPIFSVTEEENWCWTSTSLGDAPDTAIYIAFGRGTAYDGTNVHGSGSLRSDPKVGDPADYPNGRGPQSDEIRIYNYVRLVRDAGSFSGGGGSSSDSGVNLAVAALSLNQKVLTSGDVLKISAKVINRGSETSVRCLLTYYLSKDNTVGANDTYLGKRAVTPLKEGEYLWKKKNYRIPASLAKGTWTLIIVADEVDTGNESNTGNNIARVRIKIN